MDLTRWLRPPAAVRSRRRAGARGHRQRAARTDPPRRH